MWSIVIRAVSDRGYFREVDKNCQNFPISISHLRVKRAQDIREMSSLNIMTYHNTYHTYLGTHFFSSFIQDKKL